jgi:hypothetical protein
MATPEMVNLLGADTPKEEVKSRPAPGGSGKMLDYIDARFVMDRLDLAVGPCDWQQRFEVDQNGNVRCGIGVRIEREDGPEWVWKWDVGTESSIESIKGQYSDAFKRAAVHWGVARDLYDERTSAGEKPPARVASAPMDSTSLDMAWRCPVHNTAKVVPAGVSRSTGKPYAAFMACAERDCNEKPSRARSPRTASPAAFVGMGDGEPF